MFWRMALVMAAVCLVGGCVDSESIRRRNLQDADMSRLMAAGAISSESDRDEAYRQIAVDAKGDDFDCRLKAADSISSESVREEVYREIASDAASAHNACYAKLSVARILSVDLRDETAVGVVDKLTKIANGRPPSSHTLANALDIAKSISNVQLRDRALKRVVASGTK